MKIQSIPPAPGHLQTSGIASKGVKNDKDKDDVNGAPKAVKNDSDADDANKATPNTAGAGGKVNIKV